MKLLTIGLPVHNAMPYLPETIASLLGQTYDDFELLVIDDGSTDGSLEYLKSLKDRRLRLVWQDNRGLTATLNRTLEETTTPWLVRHDADDIAFTDRLSLTADYVRRFPDSGMFYSYARFCQGSRIFGQFRTTTAGPEEIRRLTKKGYLLAICHPAVTLNVEKTKLVGGYRFNLYVEDVDLWWRMALAYDIQLIPAPTVACHHNLGSISARNFERQCINALFVQYLLLSHLWQLTPLPYEVVYPRIRKLLNRRQMYFRKNARSTNISLSKKRYVPALGYACLAFLASPGHLLRRVLYELHPERDVVNGEDPKLYAKQKALLWPQQQQLQPPNITSKGVTEIRFDPL
jgi:glycosyltransferase involved in cell wall biosynthesis